MSFVDSVQQMMYNYTKRPSYDGQRKFKYNTKKGKRKMKKLGNKILVAVLACVIAITTVAPMKVEAATVAKTQTVYRSGKSLNNYIDIYVGDLKETSKITNVKSSKTSVVRPYSVTKYSNESEYFEDGKENSGEYYANIRVKLMKKGTAKISFKVDGKKKTTTVKVLNYTNPVKTANITGTVSGKKTTYEFANGTKEQCAVFLKSTAAIKNAKGTFEAKNGWKIIKVDFDNYGTTEECMMANYNGVKKVTVNLGTLKAKKTAAIYVTYRNTETKGTIRCMYIFNY